MNTKNLMKSSTVIAAALTFTSTLTACSDGHEGGDHTVDFVGFVYDGASRERLTNYTMRAEVGSDTEKADIDEETGRYVLKGISAYADYSIIIEAEGYRPFASHNSMIGVPRDLSGEAGEGILEKDLTQTLFIDSFLFPTAISPAQVEIEVVLTDSGEDASGTMRLRATNGSFLISGRYPSSDPYYEEDFPRFPGEVTAPTGVPEQVWTNDNDLQAEVITEQFSGGEVTISGDQLVYGTSYDIDVYDVEGYQPGSASVLAGLETTAKVALSPIPKAPEEE